MRWKCGKISSPQRKANVTGLYRSEVKRRRQKWESLLAKSAMEENKQVWYLLVEWKFKRCHIKGMCLGSKRIKIIMGHYKKSQKRKRNPHGVGISS